METMSWHFTLCETWGARFCKVVRGGPSVRDILRRLRRGFSLNYRSFAPLSDCLELSRVGYGKGRKTVMLFFVFFHNPGCGGGVV